MKKIAALLLAFTLLSLMLVACGEDRTYSCVDGDQAKGNYAETIYVFSGDNVTKTIKVFVAGKSFATTSFRGTYDIMTKDGAKEITFTMYDLDGTKSDLHSITAPYIEASDGTYISIGGVNYKRQ